jgi:hypothetical protein
LVREEGLGRIPAYGRRFLTNLQMIYKGRKIYFSSTESFDMNRENKF